MLGLIKKDLLLIIRNSRSLGAVVIIYILLAYTNNMDISYVFPFLSVMLFMATFSYDDYNNFNAYAITLPNGRKNVVKSKYIATIILAAVTSIVTCVVVYFLSMVKSEIIFEDSISSMFGILFGLSFLISICYPMIFKYGAEKGRLVMFVSVFAIVGLVGLIGKFVDFSASEGILAFFENNFMVISILFASIMMYVSYLVSKKIYEKKEF